MIFLIWMIPRQLRRAEITCVSLCTNTFGKISERRTIRFIRPACSVDMHDVVFSYNCCSADHPEPASDTHIRQFQQRILKCAISIAHTYDRRNVMRPDLLHAFYSRLWNTSAVAWH